MTTRAIRIVAMGLALTTAAPLVAEAQSWVDRRQARQERRIDQGIASGALTGPEARRLERGQARVERMETRTQADGVITPRERYRLDRALDVQNARIWREKHDAQTR